MSSNTNIKVVFMINGARVKVLKTLDIRLDESILYLKAEPYEILHFFSRSKIQTWVALGFQK